MAKCSCADKIVDELRRHRAKVAATPEAPCSNPHCLDGWVDEEEGTQDGSETYVGQVPCEVCRVHCDAAEAPTWKEGHRNQSICLNCGIRHDCPKIGDPPF